MTSAEKIAFMHTFFGEDEAEHKCKDCMHFERWQKGNKRVRKCKVYGLSNSEATDWNASFPACGCFNKGTDFSQLYKTRTKTVSTYMFEQLDGQIEMLDETTLSD